MIRENYEIVFVMKDRLEFRRLIFRLMSRRN
jgi:hypothetical protein